MNSPSHKKLDNYLLQLEINKNIDEEKLIEILVNSIVKNDIISISMINMFIRNNNVKLQNVPNYKDKFSKIFKIIDKENYITECNEQLKSYYRGCCVSFIPYEELKERTYFYSVKNIFN